MYGRRAFAIVGPSTWKSLPNPVRNPKFTEAAFRRLLKTFLFARYQRTQHIMGVCLLMCYINRHIDTDIDIDK